MTLAIANYRRRGWSRAQVFSNHDTVRAQCSLANIKMGLRPILEMESPPGWKPGYTYSNWIPRKIPRSRLQRSGSKTGYGLCLAHPTFRLASVCVYILLPLIIKLFPCYCWFAHISLLCYRLCTLILLILLALGNELANKWKIYTNIHSK